jgi:hypothetical protein
MKTPDLFPTELAAARAALPVPPTSGQLLAALNLAQAKVDSLIAEGLLNPRIPCTVFETRREVRALWRQVDQVRA